MRLNRFAGAAKLLAALAIGALSPAAMAEDDDGLFANQTMTDAVLTAMNTVCLPSLRGEAAIDATLPFDAALEGTPLRGRASARPAVGETWAFGTLEGALRVGRFSERAGACQILAPTPFADYVMERVVADLAGQETPFNPVTEPVERSNSTWLRVGSAQNEFIDFVLYKAAGPGAAPTLHIIVG